MPYDRWQSLNGPPQVWKKQSDGELFQPSNRFPGDPGVGKIWTGSIVFTEDTPPAGTPDSGIQWLDDNTGVEHVVRRTYSSISGWQWTGDEGINESIAAGCIPSATMRNPAPTTITSGGANTMLDAEIVKVKAFAPWPIWLEFYHEPEDNFKTVSGAAELRAAMRYITLRFRAANVTNVAWTTPAWQTDWTFTSGGVAGHDGLQWWHWDPDWKGTLSGAGGTIPNASDWYNNGNGSNSDSSVVDVMAFDIYSPTINANQATSPGPYRTYQSNMDTMHNAIIAGGRPLKPYCIPEGGTKACAVQPNWTLHWQQAVDWFIAHDVINCCYYNRTLNNFWDAPDFVARRAGYEAGFLADSRVLGKDQFNP